MALLIAVTSLAVSLALAAPSAAPAGRPRILVIDLQAVGVAPGEVSLLRDAIVLRLSLAPGVDVISTTDMKKLVELEATKMAAGCDPSASDSCLAEIAGALGAQYVVTGNVGRIGDRFVLNLALLDGAKAESRSRAAADGASLDELLGKVDAAVDDLVAPVATHSAAQGGGALLWTGAGLAGLGVVALGLTGIWAASLESTLAQKPGDPAAKERALEQRAPALGALALGVILAAAGGSLVTYSLLE